MANVAIVGAGSAGLAAAYILAGKADITLFDQGPEVKKRSCPSPHKCVNCSNCGKSNGVGGAGCNADGKFIGSTIIGKRQVGSNLEEIIGKDLERDFIIKGTNFFQNYSVDFKEPSELNIREAEELSIIAARNDMGYIFSHQAHIGTDKLPELMEKIQNDLIQKGVNFVTNEKITKINPYFISSSKKDHPYDFLILAPGRKGADWLENQLKANDVPVEYRAIDIGFRVETDAKILEPLFKVSRDIKLNFKCNGQDVRTFCACPNGFVTRETYEIKGFNLVNGASDSKAMTENSNFALLMSIPLTHNVNSNNYGDHIAMTFHDLGADKPVVQRLGDLRNKRRSREEKVHEWRVKPTLNDVLYGNLAWAMPYLIVDGLIEGIERLSVQGLMEGLNQESTLLYAPEMKRNGLRIKTDKYLRIPRDNFYIALAGDGPGISRGIVGAAASGILAAEGILKHL